MANQAPPLLIAGAGIAGLTAALALASHGFSSRIFERRPGPARVGAGIQLSPNAMHVFAQLGLTRDVLAKAALPSAIHIRDGLTGRTLTDFQLGTDFRRRFGAPYCVIHRADLEALLLDACRDSPLIALQFGAGITGVEVSDGSVTIEADTGMRASGSLLIGADGVGSTVRSRLDSKQAPRFSGDIAWRAVVDLADVPPRIPHADVGLWLLPSAHLVHYPMVGREALNIVAITAARDNAIPQKTWLEHAGDILRFDSFLSATPVLRRLLATTNDWGGWPLFEAPSTRYALHKRVVLIGDAAHAMLPYAAQGGACAVEDAAVLATGVGRVGIQQTVAQMDGWRGARARGISDLARNNRRLYHANRLFRTARNLGLRTAPQSLMQSRMGWIYGWKPPVLAPAAE